MMTNDADHDAVAVRMHTLGTIWGTTGRSPEGAARSPAGESRADIQPGVAAQGSESEEKATIAVL